MQSEPTNQQPAEPGWQFTPGGEPQEESMMQPPEPNEPAMGTGAEVSWTASEFMAHQKNGSWYGLLALAALGAASVTYLLTRDAISTGMVLVVAIVLGVYASHKPRTLEYKVDDYGVTIGTKDYPYADLKSFSIDEDSAINSINLLSLKRFMPPITMYYDPKDEDKIVDVLSVYLPIEKDKKDAVDRFMKRIKY